MDTSQRTFTPYTIAILAINLLSLAYILYHLGDLPETVPSHFNINGEANSFSGKSILWILWGVGLFASLAMIFSAKYPKLFNIPIKYDEKDKRAIIQELTSMTHKLGVLVALLVAYIIYGSIHTAHGHINGLSKPILFIMIGMILLLPIFTIIGLKKYQSNG